MVIWLVPQLTLPTRAAGSYPFDLYYGNISIISDTVTYSDLEGVKTQAFSSGDELVITQTDSSTPTTNSISVNGKSVVINITLSGVNITSNGCALELQGTSVVNLTLAEGTTNTLKSRSLYAGLQVPANTSITIDGSGTLNADGGTNAAGIGGDGRYNGGHGGIVTITGGSFLTGTPTPTPTNGSANVYLTTVMLKEAGQTSVFSLTIDAGYNYGTDDMVSDEYGILYLWLPADTVTTGAQTSVGAYQGSVTTNTMPSSDDLTKVLDTDLPTVISVTPNGADAALSCDIEIAFSETMDTKAGTVSLDDGNTTLTGGNWSNNNKTYTIPYSGLSNNKAYTISISGFTDSSNNVMKNGITHSFTTVLKYGKGAYFIASDGVSAYSESYTTEGLLNLTVNDGVPGFTYFGVNVSAVAGHTGSEVCLFVQTRNEKQISMNATKADFDAGNSAYAAFNVQSGDVIEVYIVDGVTNDASSNPEML